MAVTRWWALLIAWRSVTGRVGAEMWLVARVAGKRDPAAAAFSFGVSITIKARDVDHSVG